MEKQPRWLPIDAHLFSPKGRRLLTPDAGLVCSATSGGTYAHWGLKDDPHFQFFFVYVRRIYWRPKTRRESINHHPAIFVQVMDPWVFSWTGMSFLS